MSLLDKAIEFATQKHAAQRYDAFPYTKHLSDVDAVLIRFGINDENMRCSAYLHDTIEDTATNYGEIKNNFNTEIAEIVYAVTDEVGRTRKERQEKTYPKLAKNSAAIVLKLADCIANIEYSIASKNTKMVELYRSEFLVKYDYLCNARIANVKRESTEYKLWFAYADLVGLTGKFIALFNNE